MDNKEKIDYTLKVEALKDGTAIDHIPAGVGTKVLRMFGLMESGERLYVGLNLPSRRLGKKDLIKVESEISQTQASIEQIEAQQRDLAERIAKENLSISFEAQSTVSDAMQPVRDVWQNSLRVMAASGAAVLALIVGIIPWIPVFLAGFFAVRWLWRRATRA